MSEPDNHIDNRGAFVDSVLLKVQNSGIDYAKNIKAPVSVVLAEARQKLDQYYADFYRNKILEAEIQGEIKGLSTFAVRDRKSFRVNSSIMSIDAKDILKDIADCYQRLSDITAQFNSKEE